jgi:hypothetical protein
MRQNINVHHFPGVTYAGLWRLSHRLRRNPQMPAVLSSDPVTFYQKNIQHRDPQSSGNKNIKSKCICWITKGFSLGCQVHCRSITHFVSFFAYFVVARCKVITACEGLAHRHRRQVNASALHTFTSFAIHRLASYALPRCSESMQTYRIPRT